MKKMTAMLISAIAGCSLFAAGELDDAVLHGETDKERAIDYRPGEEMVFTLSIQGVESLPKDEYFIKWSRTGDDGVTDSGQAPASLTEPLVIRTKLDRPGFVRILAHVVDRKGRTARIFVLKAIPIRRKDARLSTDLNARISAYSLTVALESMLRRFRVFRSRRISMRSGPAAVPVLQKFRLRRT